MRKEIIGLIVSVGLVYAQAGMAKETSSKQQIAKQQQSKQYYKHAKNTQRNKNAQGDHYSQTENNYAGTKSRPTSYRLKAVEQDLPMNDSELRNHR